MLLLVCVSGDFGSCWFSEVLWEGQRGSFVCVPKLLRCKLSFSSGLEAFAQRLTQKNVLRAGGWLWWVHSLHLMFPKRTVCFRDQDSGKLV